MKIIYYLIKYAFIMILGHLVKYLDIPSMYSLPFIVLIPFNYLAISYGIKHPLEKRKDLSFKQIIIPISILTSIFNTCIILVLSPNIVSWLTLIITNLIGLQFLKTKEERQEDLMKKNIKEYFKNKKV